MSQQFIPKPEPGGLDPESILDAFAWRMMYSVARDQYNATDLDAFQALAYAVRDRLMDRWFATQDAYYQRDVKRVYYLSLEFLLGRLLISNILNLGANGAYTEAVRRLGLQLEGLAERESDAGLGNGGLGRLAACFLESASTLALPFYGYGIRYEYGIFRQRIVDGQQSEAPDSWLRYGNPWEVPRPDVCFSVKFYGRSEYYVDAHGVGRFRWADAQDVYAMAYDMAVPGYRNQTVNSLRLWAAKSSREFDLQKFNAGAYVAAVEDKNSSENISKVLYPADDQYAGRELRLRQQYFFVSATIQDVIRRFKKRLGRTWNDLPEKVAIQLNDTHPSIAIPELIRVLVDDESVEWDQAWAIAQRVFGYTNHTVLPEALETWSKELVGRLLPRHLQIIEEIDRRFRQSATASGAGQRAVAGMAIIDDNRQMVRMANLAIVGSHSVNGVARLHTEILKSRVFADFQALFPGKFNNKTNGVTPRRWLLQANPELSSFITDAIGDRWTVDLERLRDLEVCARSAPFREQWNEVKLGRKKKLAVWLHKAHGLAVDTDSLFDVQIKRIHEYKRQLLNVLHAIALAHRLADGDDSVVPRTIIFGGKAAPGYFMAKLFIRLVHEVAAFVRGNPRVAERLNVVFVPNYDVSSAEVLFPATELSEQISTAGTEASGTGCMKAVMNGGVIIGTLDGANIEIRDAVGEENIFIFGQTTEQIAKLQLAGYDPRRVIESNPELQRVIARIASWGTYTPIVDALYGGDRYFHCADFASYVEMQKRAGDAWLQRHDWARLSIFNTARSGPFSADRTVAEYAKEIWGVEPVPVSLNAPESGRLAPSDRASPPDH
jgi:starch phosphorylase